MLIQEAKDVKEEHIEHTFDSYCKRVIKNAACDYYNGKNKRAAYEVPLDDRLPTVDSYFQRDYIFHVQGFDVIITNPTLARALQGLMPDKRTIILLTCCLDLPDRIVAPLVQVSRRTVAYKRAQALQELRRCLCV